MQPPRFLDCGPASVKLNQYEILTLPVPTVTDNSGPVPILSVNFNLGSPVTQNTIVIWTAEDYEGNIATCSIPVTIRGNK